MTLPRLLLSATHRSSGKTTIALGLASALRSDGAVVQAFKKGPDYIDPMWLALASGRPCYNLDPHLSTAGDIGARVAAASAGADLCLVEGNMGLHDGMALDGSNSNAALARTLGLPVVLVIDARGMNRGIAPLLLGYQAFERTIRIAGVVLNRVGGTRHESKLRAAVEHYTDVPVIGAVAEDRRLALAERHLGLVPCAETEGAAQWVAEVGRIVAAQVDLRRLRELAEAALPWNPDSPQHTGTTVADAGQAVGAAGGLRIGIARDRAFGFYYADDLEALRRGGAELVFIDTLHDQRLPPLDGLFIGGGFPETSLDELGANAALRSELHAAITAGLPTYAECGGLMLLSRSVRFGDRVAPMVAVVPGDAVMQARPVGRGYIRLAETVDMPWPGGGPAPVLGHEFHHASLENLAPGQRFAYRVERGHGIDGRHDGIVLHNLLAGFAHLRQGAGSCWVQRFLQHVRSLTPRRAGSQRSDIQEPRFRGQPRLARAH